LGLGRGGEGEGEDTFTQRMSEERDDRLTDAGSIDDDASAVPDIFQEADKLGVEFGMAAAVPLVVFYNFDAGMEGGYGIYLVVWVPAREWGWQADACQFTIYEGVEG
jgi:hypothetical protein